MPHLTDEQRALLRRAARARNQGGIEINSAAFDAALTLAAKGLVIVVNQVGCTGTAVVATEHGEARALATST